MNPPHAQRSDTTPIQEPLGQRLINAGLISDQQLREAQQVQPRYGRRLSSLLVSMGALTETALCQFLSHQYGIPLLQAFPLGWSPSLVDLVPHELARECLVAPITIVESQLTLAMADPSNVAIIDELTFRTGCQLVPLVTTESQIQTYIQMLYGRPAWNPSHHIAHPMNQASTAPEGAPTSQQESATSLPIDAHLHPPQLLQTKELEHLLEAAAATLSVSDQSGKSDSSLEKKAPIVQLVNRILGEGVAMEASDIHIEPYETHVRIRYRLDGVLHPVMTIPLTLRNAIISRLKILSHLDIAERRLPQDGRMKFQQAEQNEIDVRISMLPGLYGEKIVLRLLNQANLQLDMTKLGMEPQELAAFRNTLSKPYGMILVTGPTGSGKTTTLYSALQVLNSPTVNIVTAEDPVEYNFPGIHQVQIKEDIGFSFAAALRSFLRQDPDIIMVGEIRDHETAQMAIKAALTGHRVLSTIHTNDAVRTISRLLDMGIEPFMVASSVALIIAQRLIRQICSSCREPYAVPVAQLVEIGFNKSDAGLLVPMRGRGCAVCHYTGYKGRIALFEVFPLSETLGQGILQRVSPGELKKMAMANGFRTLRQNGLQKIQDGVTTIDEVLGATEQDVALL
ncbi:MAG: type II secretion system protein GspE [Nitrospirales bacterium]|nr:type II secretion system protein GspE [Nitrospirales bacterium]